MIGYTVDTYFAFIFNFLTRKSVSVLNKNICILSMLGLTPDKEVRVSVKALAVSCVGAAAALHPEAFFNSLYLEPLDGLPAEGRRST